MPPIPEGQRWPKIAKEHQNRSNTKRCIWSPHMTIVDYCGLLWTIVAYCGLSCWMHDGLVQHIGRASILVTKACLWTYFKQSSTGSRKRPLLAEETGHFRKSTETPFQAPFTFSFKIENKHKQTQNGYRLQLSSKLSNCLLQRNLSSIVRHGWRPKHGCVLSVLGVCSWCLLMLVYRTCCFSKDAKWKTRKKPETNLQMFIALKLESFFYTRSWFVQNIHCCSGGLSSHNSSFESFSSLNWSGPFWYWYDQFGSILKLFDFWWCLLGPSAECVHLHTLVSFKRYQSLSAAVIVRERPVLTVW